MDTMARTDIFAPAVCYIRRSHSTSEIAMALLSYTDIINDTFGDEV